MNIRVETTGPCRKQLHVEVPAEAVSKEFGEIVDMYAGAVRLPGFRPGRAPRDMVKRRFLKDIQDEVKQRLVPRGYQEAVKQEKLDAVTVLEVKENDLAEGQPFSFTILLDVAPDFELPAYKGLALKSELKDVTDKDIDDVITNIREQNAKYQDVSGRAVRAGDMVQVDFEGTCEGKPFREISEKAASLGQAKDFWVIADEANEFLPGFAAGLAGANIGEKRDVAVTFAEDFTEPSVAGKKALYAVAVKAIREKALPDLDEAFFTSMGAENEAALRERIRTDMTGMRKSNERARLEAEILRTLVQGVKFDVPQSVLADETQHAVYDLVRSNTSRGVAKEEIEANKERLIGVATQTAEERLKSRYILRKIAAAENIAATEVEINQRIAELARSHRTTPDKLEAELEKNNQIGRVADEVRLLKTMNWLYDNAAIAGA